jgi:N-terminal domain on NACHT_NTPase and P-loop NTPases
MSGLEVLGGISAVIAIIDGSVKVWESARKDLKFSATFETVGNRLPILRDILQTCLEQFEPIKTSLPADAAHGLVKTVNNCKRRAEKLGTIFQETIPGEDDQWYERYHKMARQLGKGSKVEELMKAITEDAQNLVNYHAVKSASPALYTKLGEIAEEMASLAPSLPVDEADIQTFHNYGGTQSISTGSSTQHNNINRGSGTMNNFASITGNPTFHQGKN